MTVLADRNPKGLWPRPDFGGCALIEIIELWNPSFSLLCPVVADL